MKKGQFQGALMLLLAAFFWGSTFVAQSDAAGKMTPIAFNAARSFVGGATLLLILGVRALYRRNRLKRLGQTGAPARDETPEKASARRKRLLLAGVCCGTALAAGAIAQQYGIRAGATAGEAGFLTALYMFIVPVLAFLFYRKKPTLNILFGAVLMAAGLYFICIADAGWSSIGWGQGLTILSAFGYAVHIMTVDRFDDVDALSLSALQLGVCGLICTVLSLLFEHPVQFWQTVQDALVAILYAGIFSSAIGFTLQVSGQHRTPPAIATIFMSLESVIALLTSWLCARVGITGEPFDLTAFKLLGCALSFAGIVASQLQFGKKARGKPPRHP